MKTKNIILLFALLLFVNLFFISFINAGELKVTTEHPFLINNSWIPANQLHVGDILTNPDGKKVRIKSISEVISNKTFPVYNLEAGVYHDFVVSDKSKDNLSVIVHNSNVIDPFEYAKKSALLSFKNSPDILSPEELAGDIRYFSPRMTSYAGGPNIVSPDQPIPNNLRYLQASQISSANRDPWNDVFLKSLANAQKVSKQDVFLDIGAALPLGAPRSITLKKSWPGVYIATDVVGPTDLAVLASIQKAGVFTIVGYSPVKGKFGSPGSVKVVKFANIDLYLTPRELDKSLKSIYDTLQEDGYLIASTDIFQKTGGGFKLVAEAANKNDFL